LVAVPLAKWSCQHCLAGAPLAFKNSPKHNSVAGLYLLTKKRMGLSIKERKTPIATTLKNGAPERHDL
jgi:hypothetical protein